MFKGKDKRTLCPDVLQLTLTKEHHVVPLQRQRRGQNDRYECAGGALFQESNQLVHSHQSEERGYLIGSRLARLPNLAQGERKQPEGECGGLPSFRTRFRVGKNGQS